MSTGLGCVVVTSRYLEDVNKVEKPLEYATSKEDYITACENILEINRLFLGEEYYMFLLGVDPYPVPEDYLKIADELFPTNTNVLD